MNGEAVSAEVEPRLQLGELLREHLLLTGTHLGCEHGVCGACTVNIDGAPARSCITYAIACDGADVRTIEGFDEDLVMRDLREAFSAEHALQCGYCTPGMLVTARDIVLRLPGADEARVRKELAGNLCRCTGYVGIVRAIQGVLAKRQGESTQGRVERSSVALPRSAAPENAIDASTSPRDARHEHKAHETRSPGAQYERSGSDSETVKRSQVECAVSAAEKRDPGLSSPSGADRGGVSGSKPAPTLHQSFIVNQPRSKVWAFFGDLDQVTRCLPGATVTGTPADDRVEVTLRVKLGPIAPEFHGSAEATRDAPTWSGVIRGSARDARSPSTTRGEIRYVLSEENDAAATRVDVDVEYTLTGPLAQFGRSGLVQDIAKRMTAAFAQNVEARLGENPAGFPSPPAAQLNAGSLVLAAAWARIKTVLRSVLGR